MDNLKVVAEKEDLVVKINELISQKGVLYDRINEFKNKNSGNVAVIKRLEEQITFLQDKIQSTTRLSDEQIKGNIELDFLRKQVNELNNDLREQLIESSQATGKFEVIKDQLEQSQHQLEDFKGKHDSIKQDIARLNRISKEDKESLSKKLHEKEIQLKESEEKKRELEKELENAQEGSEFKDTILNMRNNLEKQMNIAKGLSEEVKKYKNELSSNVSEIARLKEELVKLKRRIKLLRRDLIG